MDLRDELLRELGSGFVLERELEGGMSRVFVALDERLRRRIVIKVLAPELAAELSAERFKREILVGAQLQHPHIVPLLSAGSVDGLPFFTMPWIDGESLRARLTRERTLPVADAIRILRDIASALAHAHARGVVHRDIKPENVLLGGRDAFVADFGVAKALTQAGANAEPRAVTAAGIAVGTVHYMSPEQAASDPGVDGRADLYSLGALAYELLSGAPPFTGPSPQRILFQHATELPTPLSVRAPLVPESLAGLVSRCLAKRPEDRPPSAANVLEVLEALTTGENAAPKRAGMWRRFLVAAAAFLALAGGAAAVAFTRLPDTSRAAFLSLMTRRAATLDARRIVVAPLENRTSDTTLAAIGDWAADWIARELTRTGEFVVVDPRTSLVTARLMRELPVVLRRADEATALAHETGAGTLVTGAYFADADSLLAQIRIVDVASGELRRTLDDVRGARATPTVLLERLGRSTVAALAASVDTTAVAVSRPPSFEAFAEARRGWESWFRRDTADFSARMQRAARLDTTFMMPIMLLAVSHAARYEWSAADSLCAIADAHRARLSPAEAATLDVLRAYLSGRPAASLRAAREVVRFASGSAEVPLLAAYAAVRLNQPGEALAMLAKVDPDRGLNLVSTLYWERMAVIRHELSEHPLELESTQDALRRFPGSVTLRRYEIRALAALGRTEDVERALRDYPEAARGSVNDLVASLDAARELRAHGDTDAAGQLIASALGRFDARGSATDDATQAHGEALYEAGRWREAREVFARLLARDSTDAGRIGWWGAASVRAGAREDGERALRRLTTLHGPFLLGRQTFWRAHITAVLGLEREAVALLRASFAEGHWPWLAPRDADVHSALDFAPLTKRDDFKALMDPRRPPPE